MSGVTTLAQDPGSDEKVAKVGKTIYRVLASGKREEIGTMAQVLDIPWLTDEELAKIESELSGELGPIRVKPAWEN